MVRKIIILIQIITIIVLLNMFRAPADNQANPEKHYILKASAYYPGPECTYPYDDGFTAIGDIAGKGCIAIDDKNGPLKMGQKVYVEGYGHGKCNDRGVAIKGWEIDLCFDTYEEAKEFGIKFVKVYVLGR